MIYYKWWLIFLPDPKIDTLFCPFLRVSDSRLYISTNSERRLNIYISKSKSGSRSIIRNKSNFEIEDVAVLSWLVKRFSFLFLLGGGWGGGGGIPNGD